MSVDLHYLKLFNTLASELNYSKAAKLLYISQPALSMQIKKLEKDMGITLFDRVGRKVVLNENGRLLLEYTHKIFSLLGEVEKEFIIKRDCINGTIDIGSSNTPGTYILPKIMGEFKSLYPNVSINLHISNTEEIAHMVSENTVDFAVNGGEMAYPGNVYCEKLMDDSALLVASPDNRLSNKEYANAEDLKSLNYIAHENNSQLHKLLYSVINEFKLTNKITMTFGSIDAVKQAVSANLGVSVIPYSAMKLELELGLLKEIRIKGKKWFYPYSLVYHKDKYISPAAKKLLEMIYSKLKKY